MTKIAIAATAIAALALSGCAAFDKLTGQAPGTSQQISQIVACDLSAVGTIVSDVAAQSGKPKVAKQAGVVVVASGDACVALGGKTVAVAAPAP